MSRIIEAKAVITGEDKTGKMFDEIAKKFDRLAKAGKASKGIDQMAAAMSRAQKQAAAIDKFFASRSSFSEARTRFRAAEQAIESAARAMRAGEGSAISLARAYARAEREVKSASSAFEQEKAVLLGSKHALEAMGISVANAAAHQAQLRANVDRATAAMARQERRAHRMRHLLSPEGAVGYGLGVAAGAVSAHTIARGVGHTVAAGAHYRHEGTVLANAGRTPAEMRAIDAASRATVRAVPTSTYTENRKVIAETSGAFGSVQHAIENLPFMQKTSAALHAVAGDKVTDDAAGMGNKLARVFEIRGTAGHTEQFQKEAGELVRAMMFSRGVFNPSEALNFSQQAKGAMQSYSQRFLTRIAPSIITEQGGDRAGTGANAFRSTIMGKVRDKRQTAEWIKLGMLDPKLVSGGKGSPLTWKAGAVLGTDVALANPLQWAEKFLIPHLKADGVNVDDPLEVSKKLAVLFRNQNANMFAEIITQLRSRNRLHKDADLIDQTKTVDQAYANNLRSDPTESVKALSAALDNLMTVVSSPAMGKAAQVLSSLAGGLQVTANWLADHPKTAVAGGSVVAGASLAGAGYLSLQLMRGFGLQNSAVALTGAAEALTAAAGKLSGGSVRGASPDIPSSGRRFSTGLGATSVVDALLQTMDEAEKRAGHLPTLTWGDWLYVQKRRLGISNGNKEFYGDNPYAGIHYRFPSLRDGLSASNLIDSLGGVKAQLEGEAVVRGEATIKLEASPELSRLVKSVQDVKMRLNGQLDANGPGSTGQSLPEAAAPQHD